MRILTVFNPAVLPERYDETGFQLCPLFSADKDMTKAVMKKNDSPLMRQE
jgi:hypothetical protein